jgi:hypothetical protein
MLVQFRGPFLEMFLTEESWACRPTRADENGWSFYIFRGEVDDFSTKAAPLDAVFWLTTEA